MRTMNFKLSFALAILLIAVACGHDDEPNGSAEHRMMIPKRLPSVSLDLPADVEAVDLGLSVKWASCNLGAQSPQDYGGYFGWGDPTGMLWSDEGISFNENGYTWNTTNYGGMDPTKEIGGTAQDVVTVHWGDGWRTPSIAEARELNKLCLWQLHEEAGNKWFVVTGPNGNSIIMPLCGIYGDDVEDENGHFQYGPMHLNYAGFYWTSSICNLTNDFGPRGYPINADVVQAWAYRFVSANQQFQGVQGMFVNHLRAFHMSIRPVHDK